MTTLTNVFNSNIELLENVVIVPFKTTGGGYTAATFTLPDGYRWSDFDYIEVYPTYGNYGVAATYETVVVPRQQLQLSPTGWFAASHVEGNNWMKLQANTSTTAQLTTSGNGRLGAIIGYFSRKAISQPNNLCKVINVNGGSPVGRNQRIAIDIRGELGEEYVNKDLIVQAEMYNNTGKGEAGWGHPEGWSVDNNGNTSGTRATVLNSNIIVTTGTRSLDSWNGNKMWGTLIGDITSAPIRVKVWKIDDFSSVKYTEKATPIFVTERGGNRDTGFYEVWSDGFMRQWGRVPKGNVAFPKIFKDASSLSGQITPHHNADAHSRNITDITTSTMSVRHNNIAYFWEVEGY